MLPHFLDGQKIQNVKCIFVVLIRRKYALGYANAIQPCSKACRQSTSTFSNQTHRWYSRISSVYRSNEIIPQRESIWDRLRAPPLNNPSPTAFCVWLSSCGRWLPECTRIRVSQHRHTPTHTPTHIAKYDEERALDEYLALPCTPETKHRRESGWTICRNASANVI